MRLLICLGTGIVTVVIKNRPAGRRLAAGVAVLRRFRWRRWPRGKRRAVAGRTAESFYAYDNSSNTTSNNNRPTAAPSLLKHVRFEAQIISPLNRTHNVLSSFIADLSIQLTVNISNGTTFKKCATSVPFNNFKIISFHFRQVDNKMLAESK